MHENDEHGKIREGFLRGAGSARIHGACKTAFLNKENNENTPGYLSVVVVRKDKRRQGVGSALVAALEDAFDIMIDMDDIIDLSSFEKGKEILKKYDVEL